MLISQYSLQLLLFYLYISTQLKNHYIMNQQQTPNFYIINKINIQTLKTIRILCIGDYQVGKTTFLKSWSKDFTAGDFDHNEYCSIYTKFIKPKYGETIGLQMYEPPSNYNPIYMKCYLEEQIDGVIFFYDMKLRKSRNCFFKLMKNLFDDIGEDKQFRMWNIPVLVVGLKKDRLNSEQLEQQKLDAKMSFRNIIDEKEILFMERDTEVNSDQMEDFNRFINLIALNKYRKGQNSILQNLKNQLKKYHIKKTLKSYYTFFTNYELINLSINYINNIVKTKINTLLEHKNKKQIDKQDSKSTFPQLRQTISRILINPKSKIQ